MSRLFLRATSGIRTFFSMGPIFALGPKFAAGIVFTLGVLISASAFAQPVTEYLASSSALELKSEPNWDAPVMGKLMKGEPVKVLSHAEVWAKVLYKGQERYVPFALLGESTPWMSDTNKLYSSKVAAQFRKKRFRSKKEIRATLKNVQKKGAIDDETDLMDDPELIAQLSGGTGLESGTGVIANPMDPESAPIMGTSDPGIHAEENDHIVGADPSKVPTTEANPSGTASRDPARARKESAPAVPTAGMQNGIAAQAPQAFGPAVKKIEPMKFDLKTIRSMDKYKLSEKDIRRFRAQGRLTTGD